MASNRKMTAGRNPQTAASVWQRGKWWIIGAGAIAVVVVLVVLTNSLSGTETTGREVGVATGSGQTVAGSGQPMPDFPVIYYRDYEGQDVLNSPEPRLHSLLTGKPVIMNYWASNCAPCKEEMPGFEKVWKKFQDRVLFMGLDVGRLVPGYGDQIQSQRDLRELGITYVAGSP